MSDQYYDNEVLNTSVLVEGVVWQQVDTGQSFQNDTFLSTEDGCNETQYFSMLESCSNTNILSDISGLAEYDEALCTVSAVPDIYTIEGTNEFFSFTIACDEQGNLQRYRYCLRLNENGDYEPIPESLQLVNETESSSEDGVAQDKVVVKNEVLPLDSVETGELDEDSNGLHVIEEDEVGLTARAGNDYEQCTKILDSKLGILERQISLPISKVESERLASNNFNQPFDLCNLDNSASCSALTTENEPVTMQPQQIYITETQPENSASDSSDESEFEGFHVTGDSETQNVEPILPTYILQIQQDVHKKQANSLVVSPEVQLVHTNPRSLLKSSYVFVQPPETEEKPKEVKFDKRLLKNKEFMQARLFSNYIAQTKILHAPVRQQRLPRKQTINPVKRNDEEIVVQQVVISSKGFVETSVDGVVKSKIPLKPTAIVHLTDSDDDYHQPKKKVKKKAPPEDHQVVPIIISDSEEATNDQEEAPKKLKKKRRGRPPKPQANDVTSKTKWKCQNCPKTFPSQGGLTSHMQFHKFQPNHKCDKCSETFKNRVLLTRHSQSHKTCATCKKTFANQSELNAHKRSHIKRLLIKATDLAKFSPKRHQSPKLCEFCLKYFTTVDLLQAHQKIHAKFACKNCPGKFSSKLLLQDHVLSKCVKSLKPPSSSYKQALSCDICTNKFSSRRDLFKHKVVSHLDRKPRCDIPIKRRLRGAPN